MKNNNITIGLFGTCGSSTWRETFIEKYQKENISFFNPQLGNGDWVADEADEFVKIENKNLKNNELILFPVTNETIAQAALAEIGFLILDTVTSIKNRYLVILIDDEYKDKDATSNEIATSNRSRKLVKSKVIQECEINEKVFLVDNMKDMLELIWKPYRNQTVRLPDWRM